MYRRGFGKSRPAVTTSFEKQVMAKDRAMATYGLTYDELVRVPCTYRSCHGNSYAVWNNGELTKARTEKRARVQAEAQAKEQAKEQALIDEHGVEGLKRIRAEEAAAREAELAKAAAAREAELKEKHRAMAEAANRAKLREALLDVAERCGGRAPDGAASLEDPLPKAQAKAPFALTDNDVKHLADQGAKGRSKSSYALADLAAAAVRKHGQGASNLARYLCLEALKTQHPELAADERAKIVAELRKTEAELRAKADKTRATIDALDGDAEPAAKRAKTP